MITMMQYEWRDETDDEEDDDHCCWWTDEKGRKETDGQDEMGKGEKGCSLYCWQVSRHKSITGAFIYLSYELILQIAKLQREQKQRNYPSGLFIFFFFRERCNFCKDRNSKTSSGVTVAVFE